MNLKIDFSSPEAVGRYLDMGEVSPACSDCCPCNNIYVFAGVETYLKVTEGLGWSYLGSYGCEPFPWWNDQCCTDTCFDDISEYYGSEMRDLLLNIGVVEYSSIGSKSMLCILFDYFKENNISKETALEVVSVVLTKGILLYCDEENGFQVTGSVDKMLQYLEVMQLTSVFCNPPPGQTCGCYPEEICCVSIKLSKDNWGKYAEAIGIISNVIPD